MELNRIRTIGFLLQLDELGFSAFDIDPANGKWVNQDYNLVRTYQFDIHRSREITFGSEAIGSFRGYHFPCALLKRLGREPEIVNELYLDHVVDMYSDIRECGYLDRWMDDIFSIDEIYLLPELQNIGFEKTVLLNLPSVIVASLHIFPTMLVTYPLKTKDYRPLPEGHLQRGEDEAASESLLRLYESAGFKELGQTHLYYKCINEIELPNESTDTHEPASDAEEAPKPAEKRQVSIDNYPGMRIYDAVPLWPHNQQNDKKD